eukprot:comp19388_c0_seq1/m.22394 comp19388_c0_seq1/g.22394  ORF comp19388_c0_seq1/g.22394 comp19388_c0_seq1/m.22394 type:complete len:1132 (-) comp19388_c0_seq1:561-3956(-)
MDAGTAVSLLGQGISGAYNRWYGGADIHGLGDYVSKISKKSQDVAVCFADMNSGRKQPIPLTSTVKKLAAYGDKIETALKYSYASGNPGLVMNDLRNCLEFLERCVGTYYGDAGKDATSAAAANAETLKALASSPGGISANEIQALWEKAMSEKKCRPEQYGLALPDAIANRPEPIPLPTNKHIAPKESEDIPGSPSLRSMKRSLSLKRSQNLLPPGSPQTRTVQWATLSDTVQDSDFRAVDSQLATEKGKASIEEKDEHGWTPLHHACFRGHAPIAHRLIEAGANVKAKTKAGGTTLMLAAESGSEEIIEALLDAGVPTKVTNEAGCNALMYAAARGHKGAVNVLLKRGHEDANCQAKDGYTCLMWAARSGSVAVIEALTQAGAKPDAKAKDGTTALMVAASSGCTDAVTKLFVLCGADARVNAKDKDDQTAMMRALLGGHPDTGRAFVFASADVTIKQKDGISALMAAAALPGAGKIVNHMCMMGTSDLNAKEKNGWRALHLAAHSGDLESLNALLAANADVQAKTKDGGSVLHMAALGGSKAKTQRLLDAGAKGVLQRPSKDAPTPFHVACAEGHTDVVALFLQQGGCDFTEHLGAAAYGAVAGGHVDVLRLLLAHQNPDTWGCTHWAHALLLGIAARTNQQDAVKALLSAGATLNYPSIGGGRTPLVEAVACHHVDMMALLLESGASPVLCGTTRQSVLDVANGLNHTDLVDMLFHTGVPDPEPLVVQEGPKGKKLSVSLSSTMLTSHTVFGKEASPTPSPTSLSRSPSSGSTTNESIANTQPTEQISKSASRRPSAIPTHSQTTMLPLSVAATTEREEYATPMSPPPKSPGGTPKRGLSRNGSLSSLFSQLLRSSSSLKDLPSSPKLESRRPSGVTMSRNASVSSLTALPILEEPVSEPKVANITQSETAQPEQQSDTVVLAPPPSVTPPPPEEKPVVQTPVQATTEETESPMEKPSMPQPSPQPHRPSVQEEEHTDTYGAMRRPRGESRGDPSLGERRPRGESLGTQAQAHDGSQVGAKGLRSRVEVPALRKPIGPGGHAAHVPTDLGPPSPTTTAPPVEIIERLPLAELQGDKEQLKRLGLDVTRLEAYLTDEEFVATFKMSKAEFYAMPNWKRINSKKAAKIY